MRGSRSIGGGEEREGGERRWGKEKEEGDRERKELRRGEGGGRGMNWGGKDREGKISRMRRKTSVLL